ncbi:transposon Ty3-I Gag-Pol polyprotein [Trichonephila inaurata madagascariensis]|uniref:RNA-directed DNA polymerase n=1 Tax=Trichonephila inaurata madagascariensis TaxID=2747483 RepID=A0A8X6YLG0_9ARAC|nr:transposon Ty3-I Gag-Pol polyprotein [Trichonephila inaurata madagascariensis]
MEQKKDPDLAKLKLSNNSSKNEKNSDASWDLCRKNFDPDGKLWLPVIPKHLRAYMPRYFHDAPTAGHLGFAKTYDRIHKRFYWPGMYRNVVQGCKRKIRFITTPGRLVPIPPAIAPFHRIGIDLLGRFPSLLMKQMVLVCTDYSTHCDNESLAATAEVDRNSKVLTRKNCPQAWSSSMVSGCGAVFRSRLVSSLVDLCNIDHRFTTAYHPQTNGLTERFNKTLADMLSMYVDAEQKNWEEILPFVTSFYNTAKQRQQVFTPLWPFMGSLAETTHWIQCCHSV